jgi:chemotaxis protein methyltransferase CheR
MLVDGGWLFTAPADPLLDSHAPFEVVIGRAGIVYRRPLVARELGLDGIAPIVEAAPLDQVRGADDSPTTPLAVTSVLSRPATAAPAAGGGKTAAAHALLQAQQLGNRGHLADALKAAEWAVQVHPSSAEAHYVRALLLTEAGHDRDAAATFRRALYFRGDFALAALGLGLTLGRLGDVAGARQALRRARSILSRCAPDALVDFGEGERVAGLISTVDVQLADLEARR